MPNLIVAYDLMDPGQNYDAIRKRIEGLGQWVKVQQSLYYVFTPLSRMQAADDIALVMDANDKLLVAEVSDGVVRGAHATLIADAIQGRWHDDTGQTIQQRRGLLSPD